MLAQGLNNPTLTLHNSNPHEKSTDDNNNNNNNNNK
jgi:hypothetical protein